MQVCVDVTSVLSKLVKRIFQSRHTRQTLRPLNVRPCKRKVYDLPTLHIPRQNEAHAHVRAALSHFRSALHPDFLMQERSATELSIAFWLAIGFTRYTQWPIGTKVATIWLTQFCLAPPEAMFVASGATGCCVRVGILAPLRDCRGLLACKSTSFAQQAVARLSR